MSRGARLALALVSQWHSQWSTEGQLSEAIGNKVFLQQGAEEGVRSNIIKT